MFVSIFECELTPYISGVCYIYDVSVSRGVFVYLLTSFLTYQRVSLLLWFNRIDLPLKNLRGSESWTVERTNWSSQPRKVDYNAVELVILSIFTYRLIWIWSIKAHSELCSMSKLEGSIFILKGLDLFMFCFRTIYFWAALSKLKGCIGCPGKSRNLVMNTSEELNEIKDIARCKQCRRNRYCSFCPFYGVKMFLPW